MTNTKQMSKVIWQKLHRCLVTRHGGECIHPPCALGRHIRPWRQATNAQCTHAMEHYNGPAHVRLKVPFPVAGSGLHLIDFALINN